MSMRNRRRDARHPVVVGALSTWVVISASQLWFGPVSSSVVRDAMTHTSQAVFGWMLLLSSITCLASAIIKREPCGAMAERAGMFGCAVALGFYSLNLPAAVESWNTTAALTLAGMAFGCTIRAGLVWRMIRHRETW
ncbi:hypothetical protein [Mycolicibacterium sp. A43C]